jgi:hypothetical protein
VSKPGLTVRPNGHHPPGNPYRDLVGTQFLGHPSGIFVQNLWKGVTEVEFSRVKLKTQGFNGLELFFALQNQVLTFIA